MEWFNGSVTNAISQCRQTKALFVVYVYDESPASTSTNQAWESSQVSEVLTDKKCVPLRLKKDSLECRQFSQLFPVFIYPSVFCIGTSGQVLVSTSGGQSPDQLVARLSEGFIKLEGVNNPTTVTTPTAMPTEEPDAAAQPARLDEKVQKANELIKQRRAERDKKNFEKQHSDEIARREMGRELENARQKQEERARRDWIKERTREKEAAKKAREAVLEQLAKDRKEKEARYAESRQGIAKQPLDQTPSSSPSKVVSTSGVCRIQLKLPEGGSIVVELERTASLLKLRERAAKEVGMAVESVSLVVMFPRKELGTESNGQTLVELGLAPSAVVMVRVTKSFVSSLKNSGQGSGNVFTYIFQLLLWFFTFIKNAIMGVIRGGGAQEEAVEDSQLPKVRRERLAALDGHGGGRDQETGARMRRFRQEDYRDDTDDDTKQTYNGNSTQQQ